MAARAVPVHRRAVVRAGIVVVALLAGPLRVPAAAQDDASPDWSTLAPAPSVTAPQSSPAASPFGASPFGSPAASTGGLAPSTSTQEQLLRERDGLAADLATTQEEIAEVAAALAVSQELQPELDAHARQLERRRERARRQAEQARSATVAATAELVAVTEQLEEVEGELGSSRQQLSDRAARTYMGTEVDPAVALLTVVDGSDLPSLVHASHWLSTVLSQDRVVVEDLAGTTARTERLRTRADDQRDRVSELEADSEVRVARLEELAREAQEAATAAFVEQARQQSLYDRLENKQAATQMQLDVLDRQSQELADLLAALSVTATPAVGAPPTAAGPRGAWVWPSEGRTSSPFGTRVHPIYGTSRLHAGVDIAGGYGVEVRSAQAGVVLEATCTAGGYGCKVVVDHGGGIASLYAHLSSFDVTEGQQVRAGQLVARTGSTGASTGPHLHFEVRVDGEPVDPLRYY